MKKRVLFVTQEMQPYTAMSEIATLARKLPQKTNSSGMDIRVLMPRFGTINERRHRLHEVVRLSGMNIVVNEDDYPLIIKVASLPGARMQVYFLDNDEFFKRKMLFKDADDQLFEDNEERMIFFCKSVLETVKKFGWSPDLIHCHGWLTSLIPMYIKTAYKNEPILRDSKVIMSMYNNDMDHAFSNEFLQKAVIQNVELSDLDLYKDGDQISLTQGAIQYADALVKAGENLSEELITQINESGKPILDSDEEKANLDSYMTFYKSLVKSDEEEEEED